MKKEKKTAPASSAFEAIVRAMRNLGYELKKDDGKTAVFHHKASGEEAIVKH